MPMSRCGVIKCQERIVKKNDNDYDEKTGDDLDCLSPLAPLSDMEEKSPLSIELPVSPENKSHLKKRRSKVSQNFCKKYLRKRCEKNYETRHSHQKCDDDDNQPVVEETKPGGGSCCIDLFIYLTSPRTLGLSNVIKSEQPMNND